jgi:hypothetical protein
MVMLNCFCGVLSFCMEGRGGALNLCPTSAISFFVFQARTRWVPRFFPGVKRPGRDVHHSSPFSAEVKNEQSCTSVAPLRFHGADRDNYSSH